MLVYGQNEAKDRLLKELKESNPGGAEYPSATNNRGHVSTQKVNRNADTALKGGKRREAHAEGDLVGNRSQPGSGSNKPMRKGGKCSKHASGETVPMSSEQPGEPKGSGGAKFGRTLQSHLKGDVAYKKGGRSRHMLGDALEASGKRG